MATASPNPATAIPTAARADVILRATNLHRTFKMGDAQVQVLKGTELTLRRGEFVAIEGRSGSGKSTLLHILAALDGVTSGNVTFQGEDYTTYLEPPGSFRQLFRPASLYDWHRSAFAFSSRWLIRAALITLLAMMGFGLLAVLYIFISNQAARDIIYWMGVIPAIPAGIASLIFGLALPLWIYSGIAYAIFHHGRERPKADLRNRHFGFVFQFYYLLPELNVLENTMLAPMIEHSWFSFRSRKQTVRNRAKEVLESLGLSHRLTHRPNQLSGGERQRVAIARALMNEPKVLFADEPTGNLDMETGRQIMDVLEKLHREKGQTIVMVTHDRALAREADRVLVLKNGKLEKAE